MLEKSSQIIPWTVHLKTVAMDILLRTPYYKSLQSMSSLSNKEGEQDSFFHALMNLITIWLILTPLEVDRGVLKEICALQIDFDLTLLIVRMHFRTLTSFSFCHKPAKHVTEYNNVACKQQGNSSYMWINNESILRQKTQGLLTSFTSWSGVANKNYYYESFFLNLVLFTSGIHCLLYLQFKLQNTQV